MDVIRAIRLSLDSGPSWRRGHLLYPCVALVPLGVLLSTLHPARAGTWDAATWGFVGVVVLANALFLGARPWLALSAMGRAPAWSVPRVLLYGSLSYATSPLAGLGLVGWWPAVLMASIGAYLAYALGIRHEGTKLSLSAR